jgi:hypothetical protein
VKKPVDRCIGGRARGGRVDGVRARRRVPERRRRDPGPGRSRRR